jgi:hypothetical protein
MPIVPEGLGEAPDRLVGKGDRLGLVQPQRGIGHEPQDDPDQQRHHGDHADRRTQHR